MITSFQFTRLLMGELRGGIRATVGPYYRLVGRLDTGVLLAKIEIRVWQDFNVLKEYPPPVWCHEPWMREGADWHNSRVSGMCWVLQEAWNDGMNWKGKRASAILEEGREWLLNDVRCLINRHYTAYRDGLTKWPKEWPYWDHETRGVEEYERQKSLQGWTSRTNL